MCLDLLQNRIFSSCVISLIASGRIKIVVFSSDAKNFEVPVTIPMSMVTKIVNCSVGKTYVAFNPL